MLLVTTAQPRASACAPMKTSSTPGSEPGKVRRVTSARVRPAAIASSPAPVKGFIFLETDRKVDLEAGAKDGSGWKYPLMEVEWVKRIALGQPRDGEGHSKDDAGLCAAYIPWAPLPSGAQAMEKYIDLVQEAAGEIVRLTVIVPPGHYCRAFRTGGTGTVTLAWRELN